MLARTDFPHAPWVIVEATDRYHTRIKVFEEIIRAFEDRLAAHVPPPRVKAGAAAPPQPKPKAAPRAARARRRRAKPQFAKAKVTHRGL